MAEVNECILWPARMPNSGPSVVTSLTAGSQQSTSLSVIIIHNMSSANRIKLKMCQILMQNCQDLINSESERDIVTVSYHTIELCDGSMTMSIYEYTVRVYISNYAFVERDSEMIVCPLYFIFIFIKMEIYKWAFWAICTHAKLDYVAFRFSVCVCDACRMAMMHGSRLEYCEICISYAYDAFLYNNNEYKISEDIWE